MSFLLRKTDIIAEFSIKSSNFAIKVIRIMDSSGVTININFAQQKISVEVNENIDIIEDDIAQYNKGKVLKELLTDHTRRQLPREQKGHEEDDAYIIWATDDYKSYGDD